MYFIEKYDKITRKVKKKIFQKRIKNNVKRKSSSKNKIIGISVAIIALFAIAAIIFLCIFPKEKRADYKRLSSESYDTVFLSMYPIDYFYEEDFTYWRGMNIVKASYTLPSFSSLKSYMNVIAKSGNAISTVYLGVLPEKTPSDELASLVQEYPGVHFEIILPNPPMDYWLELSETECAEKLECYRDFALPLLQYENMSLYFFGAEEWMIANLGNYYDDFLNSETAALTIMLHSDRDHAYLLTVEKLEEKLANLSALIANNRTNPVIYPDAQDCRIIFLGDSVIGNYSGSTSIPGVVAGLTNAQVVNLGLGGGCASDASDDADEIIALNDIINALICKDVSLLSSNQEIYLNTSLCENLTAYFETEPAENLCFVISYGLNDYFVGRPIASEDPYDTYTYEGAIRTAVTTLQQEYPDAHIILTTPNFTTYFENGTEYREGATHTLEDYANAVIALSQELDVELVDNFYELGIDEENYPQYLVDGCHPNETGRFLMGQRISTKLNKIL